MDLATRLRTQDGLITLAQAREHLSRWGVARRLRDGDWVPVFPAVYRDASHRVTARSRIRAVVLWAGEEAVVSGVAAAVWWSMHDRLGVVEVCVPRRCTRPSPPGVRFVRRPVAPEDRVVVEGVAVTSRAVTALDAAVALGEEDGRRLLDRALQDRVTLESVVAAHERRPRRRSAPAAAALLARAADRTASEAERRTVALFAAHGLVAVVNHPVRCRGQRFLLDLAFPAQRVALEVRGWAFHRDHDAFVADPRRRNLLVLDGWIVLEVTWADLVERPLAVVAEVAEAVAGRSAA